ncbi:HsdM family class I SAM-dependent methyltransferase [Selenomonas montiformis]|uniref:HsdM family class I SAM-dependent methyltransferase n=1 Tax=Selenomonas montiformis TaxID=2652285 RepID=UPI003F8A453A
MAKFLTEDEVRDADKSILGFDQAEEGIQQGTGQITTFNQLGIKGNNKKPDGWYLPDNKNAVAIILETKNSNEDVETEKWVKELQSNCTIIMNAGWEKVIGILHNGYKTNGFMNNQPLKIPDELQNKKYYIDLVVNRILDKEKIYTITARINDNLHFNFRVKNLYHRMIFTACALVAERYGAKLEGLKGRNFSMLHNAILSTINKSLEKSRQQNAKLSVLEEVYSEIKMNAQENQEAIDKFIDCVCEIYDCINSNEWRGEDVMGIFFNEFNRFKKKSEAGQVFTPEHITSFMYRLIGVNQNDYVGDFCCGSGAFLAKSMSNMMKEAGGYNTEKAKEIRQKHLYGIESDREIFALACANMLIHKDGKTNLEQLDTRTEEASDWIKSKPITKVLMNPPYETKYGCIPIVENVLDSVNSGVKCAFILPDKKLEKASKKQIKRILSNHRLEKIIKLPEPLFFGVGITTSIFVFIAHEPQNDNEIFACYMEDDGLETVKNKGRHDVKNKWQSIEDYWIDSISKYRDEQYNTIQWLNPNEHLSYQKPEKPFQISEEDFMKTTMDYICFKQGIDARDFGERILNKALYNSEISTDDLNINIKIGGKSDD